MNQKELTKTFMMISNWIKPFDLKFFFNIQRLKDEKVRFNAGVMFVTIQPTLTERLVLVANTRRWPKVELMLGHRLRRISTLAERLLLSGRQPLIIIFIHYNK